MVRAHRCHLDFKLKLTLHRKVDQIPLDMVAVPGTAIRDGLVCDLYTTSRGRVVFFGQISLDRA